MTKMTIQRVWQEVPQVEILLNSHDEVVGQCGARGIGGVGR